MSNLFTIKQEEIVNKIPAHILEQYKTDQGLKHHLDCTDDDESEEFIIRLHRIELDAYMKGNRISIHKTFNEMNMFESYGHILILFEIDLDNSEMLDIWNNIAELYQITPEHFAHKGYSMYINKTDTELYEKSIWFKLKEDRHATYEYRLD